MKKAISLPLQVEAVTIDNQSLMRVHVPNEAIADYCLCLQLLLEGLVERLVFSTKSCRTEFSLDSESHFNLQSKSQYSISFKRRDCEYVASFFLRCYRDGFAEVDHIDVETPTGGYITLSVDSFAPPVSADEARRRLGIREGD